MALSTISQLQGSQVSYHSYVPMDIIRKSGLIYSYDGRPINWSSLTTHPHISMDFIDNNSHLPWDWYVITYNPNINVKFIRKYSHKYMSYFGISKNTLLTKSQKKEIRKLIKQ